VKGHARLGVLVGTVMTMVSGADAATKLCVFPTPMKVVWMDAPPDPEIVIDRRDLARFVARTPAGARLAITPIPLHDHWVRVKIHASTNTAISIPSLNSACRATETMVRTTSRWSRDDRPPTNVAVETLHDEGWLAMRVTLKATGWQRLRVDWAYSPYDLRVGLHGTRIEIPNRVSPVSRFGVPVNSSFEVMFLRLTPLLLDGSYGRAWTGWVHRDPVTGTLRVGQGRAPATSAPGVRSCKVEPPWIVGEDPTFAYHGHQRAFRAVTMEGRTLPTRIVTSRSASRFASKMLVTVAARHGEGFRIEALPPGSDCPLETRVVRGRNMRRVVLRPVLATEIKNDPWHQERRFGVAQVTSYEHVHLRLATATSQVVARYGSTSGREDPLPVVAGSITLATSDGIGDWTFEAPPAPHPQGVRVRLAPLRFGFEGRACEVWLVRDPGSGSIELEAPTRPSTPPTVASCLDPYAP
jgi:hypothetical protein